MKENSIHHNIMTWIITLAALITFFSIDTSMQKRIEVLECTIESMSSELQDMRSNMLQQKELELKIDALEQKIVLLQLRQHNLDLEVSEVRK